MSDKLFNIRCELSVTTHNAVHTRVSICYSTFAIHRLKTRNEFYSAIGNEANVGKHGTVQNLLVDVIYMPVFSSFRMYICSYIKIFLYFLFVNIFFLL